MNMVDGLRGESNHEQYNKFGVLVVALMMFLPLSGKFNILRLVLALLLFVGIVLKKQIVGINPELTSIFSFMVLSIIVSRLAVIMVEGSGNFSSWLHEVQRIGFYIVLIFVVYNYKISYDFLFKICVVTLLFHTTIQTLQLMGVEQVFDFIETYYLEEGDSGIHLSLARSKNIASFRSGSIYMNPNVYMVIPLSILGIILQRNKIKPSTINVILIAVDLYSLLLTGSRTTLIVALCMIVFYVVKSEELGGIRWVILSIGMISLLVALGTLAASYRAFDVASGLSNSFGVKIKLIWEYIINSNPLYLFTGSLSSENALNMDFEWAHIYVYFGLFGIAWYIKLLKLFFRNKEKYPIQAKLLVLNVFLIALTASVILCMPVFSFFCLVSLVEIE